jgi:hypothetical protein
MNLSRRNITDGICRNIRRFCIEPLSEFWNLVISQRGKVMILELAIIGAVAGAMLGRYKVMILVPAIIFSVIHVAVVGLTLVYSLWLIVLIAAVLMIAVQVGYLVGLALREVAERFQAQVERKRVEQGGRDAA